jgi:hypothetical protein
MSGASEAFVYGEQVSHWFRRSAGLFESLSASCGLLETIVDGEPAVNLEGARKLGEQTRRAELVLFGDPCPDPWGARQLDSVVATLVEVGHEVVQAFGDPRGAERTMLEAKVASARRMVTELERLAQRLLSDGGS